MPSVLVADDDPQMRGILRTALEGAGFRVAEAENGIRALRALEEGDFDLLVLDVFMPGLGGLDVLRGLPPRLRGTPAIVMTGGADRPQVEPLDQAKRMGAVRTFSKPFELAEMVKEAVAATKGKP